MAKRRRKTTRRKSPALSARSPRKTTRRRRRMSAGGQGIFKMLSDPMIGGIAGAVVGVLAKNLAAKMVKDNKMIGTAIPVIGAFFLKKKLPFVAAGMVGAPVLSLLAEKIAFLRENDAVFVSPDLLNDDSPLFLDEGGAPLVLAENTYSLDDDDNGFYLSDDDDNE